MENNTTRTELILKLINQATKEKKSFSTICKEYNKDTSYISEFIRKIKTKDLKLLKNMKSL